MLFIVFIAISTLTVKASTDGQASIFNFFIERYVEETAASVVETSQNQLADINSLFALPSRVTQRSPIDLNTIQETSVVAYASVLEDASNDFSEKSTEVADYTVQDGDTLSFIASDFGVSVNTIIWANNLKSADDIKPGQELRIPAVSGVLHKVQKGDTLESIAKKYGVEADRVLSFNDLPQNGSLQIGDEITVPDGKIAVLKQAPVRITTAQRFSALPDLNSYFGLPAPLGYNWGKIHGRNGVDIANACGTPIFASADGTVNLAKTSGYNGGFGKFVRITHPNGTETLYAHASKILVAAGQFVSKGTQIALMGTTGRSTGCHVHFEVHGAQNPLSKR